MTFKRPPLRRHRRTMMEATDTRSRLPAGPGPPDGARQSALSGTRAALPTVRLNRRTHGPRRVGPAAGRPATPRSGHVRRIMGRTPWLGSRSACGVDRGTTEGAAAEGRPDGRRGSTAKDRGRRPRCRADGERPALTWPEATHDVPRPRHRDAGAPERSWSPCARPRHRAHNQTTDLAAGALPSFPHPRGRAFRRADASGASLRCRSSRW
jgi:hypothetical protein